MKKSLFFVIALAFLCPTKIFAQEFVPKPNKFNKGRIYVYWGWNRSWYTNSDIHFKGDNYDFTLNDVHAQDRQHDFALDPFFVPQNLTLPQTDFRIGYFINEKIDISFGYDHMKYIMPNGQTAEITGKIYDNSGYDGTYFNDDIKLDKDFLYFEHSDGLNYLNLGITRNDDLLKLIKANVNPRKFQVNALIGFDIGPVMPKSNVTLWNNERNDEFHIAGYGFSGKLGLNLTFFNAFFLRGELKGGFIDLPDVRTSPNPSDKADHHFWFTEIDFVFGFTFNPFKN